MWLIIGSFIPLHQLLLTKGIRNMNASDFLVVLPEVLLSLYAMLALVVFVYTGKDKHAVF